VYTKNFQLHAASPRWRLPWSMPLDP